MQNKNISETEEIEQLTQILFITSYPPRECGIATYSKDLIHSIENKFGHSFSIKICALETHDEKFNYDSSVIYKLNTSIPEEYKETAEKINKNKKIKIVVIQHEFGFYNASGGSDFLLFLNQLKKLKIIVFHTVLPNPDINFKFMVQSMVSFCDSVIVMTNSSKAILEKDYAISNIKVEVIAHGTHLVSNKNKAYLKKKYGLKEHIVFSTFGLLNAGKGIETTLDALPSIVKAFPEVIFLVIGKTHPGVIKLEGEKYRRLLEEKVTSLNLEKHVKFINQYLELPVLLEYLRLTDIYLFTSIDPNQAVSGTFSYAMSCGCPIISTPIAQAHEMLDENTGIVIGFRQSVQLAKGTINLLKNESLRKKMVTNALHKIAPTAWENSAIAHALLFDKILDTRSTLQYSEPPINLKHVKQLTTDFGMVQFSKINQPDIRSGYTLDDNARALISVCMHYEATRAKADLELIKIYLNFINHCLQYDGTFLNYVDKNKQFTHQNNETNLEDANGRAIWALGYLFSCMDIIPEEMIQISDKLMRGSEKNIESMYSSRAMALSIKGLFYYNQKIPSTTTQKLIEQLADRLVAMYEYESETNWNWYESYLTYANSLLPEAILFAWMALKKSSYLKVAKLSFDFLLSQTFEKNEIKVISNNGWFLKGGKREYYGEQPIDVSYTIMALDRFYSIFGNKEYLNKLKIAFNWFLGKNHLKNIIYNPCTGGCYDGLEENQVNLNQGAESTVSYLMARMIIEKYTRGLTLTFEKEPDELFVQV